MLLIDKLLALAFIVSCAGFFYFGKLFGKHDWEWAMWSCMTSFGSGFVSGFLFLLRALVFALA